ncbi:MAG: HD domain-containing protein [Candidatus Kappaea frigidicola]|nr:HD domain-containing protein [Candidatus Kappaea frigidicola]
MTKIAFKSLSEQGILEKLIISILLMAIIPLVLVIYILHTEAFSVIQKSHIKVIIFFMIASISVGYFLSRRIVVSVLQLVQDVKGITHGNYDKRIIVSDNDEISMLAQYFNQITDELEKNIKDLHESKKVIQKVLLRIGTAMSSDQTLDNILELTIETSIQALGATSGAIFIKDKSGCLRVMISSGLDKEIASHMKIEKGEGFVGNVFETGKAGSIEFTQKDISFEKKIGLAQKSLMCASLIAKGKAIGIITIEDKKANRRFNEEDDIILLENLAGQVAIAIENNRLNQDIESTYLETISTLALAVEAKDPYTRGHAKRVADYSLKMADEFALDKATKNMLRDAALLHDIGKIGVKDDILLKPGKLTSEERRHMELHPIIGENILRPIHSLSKIAHLVRHHHERVDGSGYPDGLSKEDLTLPLKIMTAADAYDAMTSNRPYRNAMTHEEAIKELQRCSGSYFDPKVVEVFVNTVIEDDKK